MTVVTTWVPGWQLPQGYAVHGELTADGEQIVLVATGPDWQIARAARQLALFTPLARPTDPPGALAMPLSWVAVVQLAATFGHAWRPGPALAGWIADQVRVRANRETLGGRFDQPAQLLYAPPDGFVPRAYQTRAARLIAATGRVLLFDEAGTGKTISAILGLVQRDHEPPTADTVFPALVVCPASVIDPWVTAWRDWWPRSRAVAWRGPNRSRLARHKEVRVFVTSYDTLRIDAGTKPFNGIGWRSLVIDECHYIKNPDAARSREVRRVGRRVPNVVALSGTPITHNPGDLWPTLEALEHVAWPSRERYVYRYCAAGLDDYAEGVFGLNPHTEPEFRRALLGQYRRVAKQDVLPQLPPKVYSVRSVDLPAAHRQSYDLLETDMLTTLPDGQQLSVFDAIQKFGRLLQLASAAADVEVEVEIDEQTGELKEHVRVTLKRPSWKADILLEVMAERPGRPIVAFTPSRQLAQLAGALAQEHGYKVGYLTGAVNSATRTQTIAAFQRGELDLLAATTGAGGTGITLTAAGTVVFLQRPLSLAEALQAEDRCHRIGSEGHESIEIIDIVARDTADERVREILRTKGGALSELVQDPRIVRQLLGGKK